MIEIFINENEDVLESLLDNDIHIDKKIKNKIKFISKKANNNYIGYFQFKYKKTYIKLVILPKTSKKLKNSKSNYENFYRYLKKYQILNNEYKLIKEHEISSHIIDMNYRTLDDIINKKYKDSLEYIYKFFKKHNKSKSKSVDFKSQSIRNKINIVKNIIEVDKSCIHQTKSKPIKYSILATVTSIVIKYFNNNLLNALTDSEHKIRNFSQKTLNYINKSFHHDSYSSIKVKDVPLKKIKKLFKSKDEKLLYHKCLILLGMDEFIDNTTNKIENMISIFFRPEDYYELVVYNYYKQKYPNAIIKTALAGETSISYKIHGSTKLHTRDSEPDIIVEFDDLILLIDAKWKILKSTPDLNDELKLERDYQVLKKYEDKKIKTIFAYPVVNILDESFKVLYNEFNYDILEIC